MKEEVENEVQRRDGQLEYNEVKWLLFSKNILVVSLVLECSNSC